MATVFKRILVGRPIATTEQEHQRIPKVIALAVFSSDAISSTAYATEEILFVTAVGASSLALGLDTLIPIAVAVALLLSIVAFSYRQTIFAYPSGGGRYVVSRENLGENPSLVAGASLLVDYILTVAVSISAGVAAIVSIPEFRDLADHRVLVAIVLIALISVANLRGIKESGRIFAAPTYLYILMITTLVGYGLFRSFVLNDIARVPFDPKAFEGTLVSGGSLGLFLVLKGFSSGAVALTGVEAISNGVPAFRRPESKNAAATLVWMATILGSLFLAGAATLLIIAFGGVTNALIPLSAVGVFTSFTPSQLGMVRHHRRLQEAGWKRHIAINGVGATATFVVLIIVAATKFSSGAWVPIVVIPMIITLFKSIKRHYARVGKTLRVDPGYRARPHQNTVIVLVGRVHKGVLQALTYAKSLNARHLVAVSVVTDDEEDAEINRQWDEFGIDVPLETVFSPYRELHRPLTRFIDELDARYENDIVTVIIPEFVVKHWWEHLLHNQSALFLKARLLFRKGTVVTSVPYHVD